MQGESFGSGWFSNRAPTSRELCDRLNRHLGFPLDAGRDQEWGYLNSDASRLGEFLGVYGMLRAGKDVPLGCMMELILCSLGGFLAGVRVDGVDEARLVAFVDDCRTREHREAFRFVLQLCEDDAPIAGWLGRTLEKAGVDPAAYLDE